MRDDIDIEIRTADIGDGHVSHTALVTIADHARGIWLDQTFGVAPPARWAYVIVHLELSFREVVLFTDRALRCAFTAAYVGRSSVRFGERIITPDGRLVAEGTSTIVAWDGERPRPLTGDERRRIAGWATGEAVGRQVPQVGVSAPGGVAGTRGRPTVRA